MAARAHSDSAIERLAAEGAAQLRKQRAANAPDVVNVGNALALGEPIPLVWAGVDYTVRPISYRDGLQLQGASLFLSRMREHPPQTVEEVDDCEVELIQMLALFHSLIEPKPEANPFADASPQEVGALLGFFWASLTIQGGQSPSRMGARPN